MRRPKIFLFLLPLFCSLLSAAQTGSRFSGTWKGALQVGVELHVVFHIKEDGKGGFSATADSPDQSAYDLVCDVVTVTGNELTIEMNDLNAVYKGSMVNDSTIDGEFTQGQEMKLVLKKEGVVKVNNRPQTPQPPFPYKSEEVTYINKDSSIRYGATITIPQGNGPFPAVLLITGSGPQDRNETIFNHKPFAVIADELTRQGIIVLRVDDRGVGKSTGDFGKATSEDFAVDAGYGLDYLVSRPEVNKKKVGLIGHSEGGMIAPMVAVKRKEVSFIILLAAPGVNITELMAEQNAAVLQSSGVSAETVEKVKPLFTIFGNMLLEEKDSKTALATALEKLENWAANADKKTLEELDFETTAKRKAYLLQMALQMQTPWFRYFMKFRPSQYLEQLRCKVLALNGSRDIQVISSQNLPGIERSLKKSKVKSYEIKEMPGLNHLFQTCKACSVEEYGKLEETFSPAALKVMTDWLKKEVQEK